MALRIHCLPHHNFPFPADMSEIIAPLATVMATSLLHSTCSSTSTSQREVEVWRAG